MRKDINAYVEERLQQWAEWHARHTDHGIGYRKQSNEYLIMRDKGVMIKGTTQFSLPTDETAEEIERLVTTLAQDGPAQQKMAASLRKNYCGQGTMEDKARAVGLRYSCFKVYLDMARQWLAGRFSVNRG